LVGVGVEVGPINTNASHDGSEQFDTLESASISIVELGPESVPIIS
jgi:hypothetical protein